MDPLALPHSRRIGAVGRRGTSITWVIGGRSNVPYAPLHLSTFWLVGSYVLFLMVGQVSHVPDLFKLTTFIAVTTGCFVVGYWLKAKTWVAPSEGRKPNDRSIRRWTLASAVYLAVFGLALMRAYEIDSVSQVVNALQNPGSAYFYRLRDAELETEVGAVQLLTLLAALSTPAVPFAIVFWERLTFGVKAMVFIGATIYSAYWVAIGTQKGIGDLAVYAAVGLTARAAMRGERTRRRTRWVLGLLVVLFGVYMVFNQADRLASENTTGGFAPNPIVTAIAGEDLGRGMTTTLFYPTHGYLGLSYNLETSFEWAGGRGSSRALDSYWVQYLDTQSALTQTYPYRTQQETGWPWDQYWATLYPWLASDLSFYGVPPFMALVGWWLARWWHEAIYLRRRLSLLLACQLGIFIAYVPANNQLGITRSGLITVTTLLLLYCVWSVHAAVAQNLALGRTPRSSKVDAQ